jgi:hypothetical protein
VLFVDAAKVIQAGDLVVAQVIPADHLQSRGDEPRAPVPR